MSEENFLSKLKGHFNDYDIVITSIDFPGVKYLRYKLRDTDDTEELFSEIVEIIDMEYNNLGDGMVVSVKSIDRYPLESGEMSTSMRVLFLSKEKAANELYQIFKSEEK